MKHTTHKPAQKAWDGSLDMLWDSFRSGLVKENAPAWLEAVAKKCFVSGAISYYLHVLVFPELIAAVHEKLNGELETMSAEMVAAGMPPIDAMIVTAKKASGRV